MNIKKMFEENPSLYQIALPKLLYQIIPPFIFAKLKSYCICDLFVCSLHLSLWQAFSRFKFHNHNFCKSVCHHIVGPNLVIHFPFVNSG